MTDQPGNNPFDPTIWYRLKNSCRPSTHCLDVVNDNHTPEASSGLINITTDGYYSGQYWQIKASGNDTYVLRTWWLGPARQLGVDSTDQVTPVMQHPEQASSQHWRIASWGDGTWRFEATGGAKNMCLDTEEEVRGRAKAKLVARDDARTTQRWTVTPIEGISQGGY